MTCAACVSPDREALEQAIVRGVPAREVARAFNIGRNVLARHRDHFAVHNTTSVPSRDHFGEAVHQLSRASTETLRLRGLEAVRSALGLEMRDHARSRAALKRPSADQVAMVRANLEAAWNAYDSVATAGVDLALRALGGVREAIAQYRAALALLPEPEQYTSLQVRSHEGTPLGPKVPYPVAALEGVPLDPETGHYIIRLELPTGPSLD